MGLASLRLSLPSTEMMLKELIIKTILLFLLGLAATDAIAGYNWVLITSSDTKTYEARAGSVEYVLTESGEPAILVLFRVSEIATKTITFERHYVRIVDCRAGFGKLGTTDLSGRVTYDADFVFDGGNVSSIIAQAICMAADAPANQIPRNIAPKV